MGQTLGDDYNNVKLLTDLLYIRLHAHILAATLVISFHYSCVYALDQLTGSGLMEGKYRLL